MPIPITPMSVLYCYFWLEVEYESQTPSPASDDANDGSLPPPRPPIGEAIAIKLGSPMVWATESTTEEIIQITFDALQELVNLDVLVAGQWPLEDESDVAMLHALTGAIQYAPLSRGGNFEAFMDEHLVAWKAGLSAEERGQAKEMEWRELNGEVSGGVDGEMHGDVDGDVDGEGDGDVDGEGDGEVDGEVA